MNSAWTGRAGPGGARNSWVGVPWTYMHAAACMYIVYQVAYIHMLCIYSERKSAEREREGSASYVYLFIPHSLIPPTLLLFRRPFFHSSTNPCMHVFMQSCNVCLLTRCLPTCCDLFAHPPPAAPPPPPHDHYHHH